MLNKIALGIVAVFAVILIYGAFQPNRFRVQRSIAIQAPPEKIFPLINDFHNWPQWSPYEKLDPHMKRTLGGPASGAGATYAWAGNGKAGKGRMEITQSVPFSKVVMDLDFMSPMEARDQAEFTLQPSGNTTNVTWAMTGPMAYATKVTCIFVSMDRLIGGDIEEGLANMKKVAEK